jgi:microcin C transport system substrate-binding protein
MRVMTLKMLAPAFRVCCAVVVSTLLFFSASAYSVEGQWVHAYAAYGEPKYPKGFAHFEYVSPDAPKGGVLRLRNPDRRSSFDKFNPWTVRGNAPAGVLIWMVEGLTHLSQDEPQTMYGLLAQDMMVAPDYSSITFRIHPQASFNNGDPVLAEDVAHSFRMLSSKGAAPLYQSGYSDIEKVVVLNARTVRFDLRKKAKESVFLAGTMPVFSRKWGEGKKFDEIVTEWPITSGPYLIDKVDMPRGISFKFNPQYWAKDLSVRRGHFNFERIVYRNYQELAVSREAFKAGEFDIFKEYGGRSWVRQHRGPKWEDGRIVKKSFETATGQGLQAYILNLRKPIFQDRGVREALGWALDFDTLNKTKLFKRAYSVFNNSEFAAQGLPSAEELKLLEPFRSELPTEVFGPAYVPPSTGGEPNRLRRNLLKAKDLLAQAGWNADDKGVLRNAKGEAFEIEYLTPREGGISDYQHNLAKLGITLKERTVDFALYARRLDKYDFDVVGIVGGDFTLPNASDLDSVYGSKSADEDGNQNFRGVKSRAVDHLLEVMSHAKTIDELRSATRAFDRVVMWNHWQVPDLYMNTENVSYWNKFGIPQKQPLYFTADTYFGEFGPWPLWTWWDKSLEGKK